MDMDIDSEIAVWTGPLNESYRAHLKGFGVDIRQV